MDAWKHCVSARIYQDNPFMKRYSFCLALFSVLFISFIIGLSLDDKNSIIGTICLGLISAILLFQLLFSKDIDVELFKKSNLEAKEIFSYYKIAIILFFFIAALAGICISQYMYLHLMWMLIIWLFTAIIIVYSFRIIIKPVNVQSYRNILKIFIFWIVAFVFVPILCLGYNVFAQPYYARVFDGTLGYGRIMRFIYSQKIV